jgi:hypothetical protein
LLVAINSLPIDWCPPWIDSFIKRDSIAAVALRDGVNSCMRTSL